MAYNSKYSFSFTGASVLIAETLVIAEEYDRLKDWQAVQNSVLDNNLLNKVKQATSKREFTEIKKRLSLLTSGQLYLLIHGDRDEAKAMILLSLVKLYAYLNDFIVEVVRNKYLLFDNALLESDYVQFYNAKSISRPELNEITEGTAKKVKQRVFALLKETGIITKTRTILKPVVSDQVVRVVTADNAAYLTAFLYSNEEINSTLQKMKHAQKPGL